MRGRTAIDLTGQRFGRIVVVGRVSNDSHGLAKWSCLCDCGNTTHCLGSNLRRGTTKSCGCLTRDTSKHTMARLRESINSKTETQLVGFTFNRLTVSSLYDTENSGSRRWLALCTCGNEVLVRTNALVTGRTKSCGCWRADSRKKDKGMCSRNHLLATYKASAARRHIEWNLTDNEFFHTTSKDCHYCGEPPAERKGGKRYNGSYTCNGVDRMDNDLGYMKSNVVPACKDCNRMKGVMEYAAFRKFLLKAGNFQLQASK